ALGIAPPLAADATAPGYIIDGRGRRIAAVNMRGLDLDGDQGMAAARELAAAVNWFAGLVPP
ncbi:MAG: hypothetical protein VW338_17980, partial [Rhodospirillaceae bacterium]